MSRIEGRPVVLGIEPAQSRVRKHLVRKLVQEVAPEVEGSDGGQLVEGQIDVVEHHPFHVQVSAVHAGQDSKHDGHD
eukprot:340465-Rhodomonas_salina.5